MSDKITNRICKNKFCKKVGVVQDIRSFAKDSRRKDGIRTLCKECINIRRKKYSSIPHNKLKIYKKQFLYSQTINGRFSKYKDSANHRKLDFQLTLEQFSDITSKKCYYCDKFSKFKNYTGIDRVNSNLGYIIKNCVPCCDTCNYMKSDLEFETLYQQCRLIVEKEFNRRIMLEKRYDIDYESYI